MSDAKANPGSDATASLPGPGVRCRNQAMVSSVREWMSCTRSDLLGKACQAGSGPAVHLGAPRLEDHEWAVGCGRSRVDQRPHHGLQDDPVPRRASARESSDLQATAHGEYAQQRPHVGIAIRRNVFSRRYSLLVDPRLVRHFFREGSSKAISHHSQVDIP